MIIKKTTNRDEIKRILCDPFIYDTISSDNSPSVDEFEPSINNNYKYVGGYLKGKIFALAGYHLYRDGIKYHPNVLKEFRGKNAKEFTAKTLSLIDGFTVYAEIPVLYKNVIMFAREFGFRQIETNKDAFAKKGKKHDKILLRLKQ